MTIENAELKSEMLRQKQPAIVNNENECGGVKQPIRPVSMYETREGIKCDTIQNVQVSLEIYNTIICVYLLIILLISIIILSTYYERTKLLKSTLFYF